MSFMKTAFLAGLAGMTAPAATAADLPRRVLLPRAPVLDTTESWYLRGDVGYTRYKRPGADFALGQVEGDMAREGFRGNGVAGVGIGYRFGPLFRADLTVDHRFDTRFKGLPSDAGIVAGSVSDRGRFQSSSLMLNAYADLGTYKGFTPYLGTGIGVAHNILSDYTRTGAALGTVERLAGEDDYDLAWALMAGVGYKLSSSSTVDLGYRYVSLGDVKTRGYESGAGADVESIGSHEVRLGVRYALP
ncbi:outer membrane protein [Microvirga makkahensis]|uniref:Outer membrane beta-barrel protein n=1 Tax=Microvirga makkahensis TaxID=1128670 RepID=A0A7X3MVF2_9HYPH|nr:outer membrane protein [Microvirga makkahensis]MXQ13961.1 outer membrane beta-barrel protein [Microvirga makkahensis]